MIQLPLLFDTNGNIGCGARQYPDFRNAQERLAHMDRLGIAYALVWQTEAQDYNTTMGNQMLIKALDATDEAYARLFPVFTITPSMYYEHHAMDHLTAALSSGRVSALNVFSGWASHALMMAEPIIDEVRQYKPVLLLDSRRGLDELDVLRLAERYPDLNLIYMQGMWGSLRSMFDLMRRSDNICIDTSWVHTRGTIEQVTQTFGAQRMVFGIGPRSHNGASIAALAHADISEDERRQIAHLNIVSLLGMTSLQMPDQVSAATETNAEAKPLWQQISHAVKIEQPIVDAHGHVGAYDQSITADRTFEKQVPDVVRRMDKLGIDKIIVSSEHAFKTDPVQGHHYLVKSLQAYQDRFLGYLAFNPHYQRELTPLLDQFFANPFFVGFKLHCNTWGVQLTDPRFTTVWEYANTHRLPILMHTWQGKFSAPSLLKKIVKQYPDAIFLLGHAGGGDEGRCEAEALARDNQHVYLEWCGSFTSYVLWEETIRRLGNQQIIFGSDTSLHDPAWELGRLLSLDVPEETIRPILADNMNRILSLRK